MAQETSVSEEVTQELNTLRFATVLLSWCALICTYRDENERLKKSVLLVSKVACYISYIHKYTIHHIVQEAQSTQELLNKTVGELMEENSQLATDKIQSIKVINVSVYKLSVSSKHVSCHGTVGREP